MGSKSNKQNEGENNGGPLQFFLGLVLLAVGLFWFSQSIMVQTNWFSWRLGGVQLSSGLSVVPLILGIIWMFFNPKSWAAKIVTILGGILIVASIIMSINFHFVRTSLFSFIVMISFMAAGSGLLLRALFRGGKS